MVKAGIMIDPWKLPIFKKELKKKGYTFEIVQSPEIVTLKVDTDDLYRLQDDIKDMQQKAKNSKKH